MWHLGVDEAGRGPVIGPLVVAAFTCPASDLQLLIDAGVDDSKRLSSQKREQVREWLLGTAAERGWCYHVYHSSPAAIDNAMQRGTLNEHECDLFAYVISQLSPSTSSGLLLLDACDVDEQRFAQEVCRRVELWPWPDWQVESKHGADGIYAAVAAASILAKYERDAAIHSLCLSKAMDLGSGYPSDPTSQKAVRDLIIDGQPDEHLRWRWKTVERVFKERYDCLPPMRPEVKDGISSPAQRTLF